MGSGLARHGEVLEVVVGEADDDGHEQTAEGEHAHHRPGGPAEAVQPALGGDLLVVALVDGDELQRDGEEAELHVAHLVKVRVGREGLG